MVKDRDFAQYTFPIPQYLGAKFSHLSWIERFAPPNVTSVLDAFSGSQSVAYCFKQMGRKVITNDFMNFNHTIGLALIENSCVTLTDDDVRLLFYPAKNKSEFTLMEDTFEGLFFSKETAWFLDNFRANISSLQGAYKQALALTVMNRALTRKTTMGHFAHTKALSYAMDEARVMRNKSLAEPIPSIFMTLLPLYNAAVFDNDNDNISYNKNILDLLPEVRDVDLAYFDPPYCNSHADYQSFYHLLETYTNYWRDMSFVNSIKRYDPPMYSGFDKKKDVLSSFARLFELADEIPYWLISYNDRSYPSVDVLAALAGRHRNVTVEYKEYYNSRGGKGSVRGSSEILLVCHPYNH